LKHCLPNLDTGAKQTGAIVEASEEQITFPANKTFARYVNSTEKRGASRCGGALVEDETMTFALGLFATLISAMFIATFASSVIVSSREAQADEQNSRYRVF
jgi:hypothetical protein